MKKIKVGILFGGRSAEHEISLQSAKNVLAAIDRDKYEPVLIGIDKMGNWILLSNEENYLSSNVTCVVKSEKSEVVTLATGHNGVIYGLKDGKAQIRVDIFFPVLHGPFGEDGVVQGLLKSAGVPFVGADVLGSAVGMDKDVMKRLLRDANIKVGKYLVLKDYQDILFYAKVTEELGSPFYVKPANMGSSVGVSKVTTESEYTAAIKGAFKYDRKILLEENITGREVECAVLGNDHPQASIVGEIVNNTEFYSYAAKYIDENSSKVVIPADITKETQTKIQNLALKVFEVLGCEGLGRVDSFLTKSGEIVTSELNTLPGFTSISMYPKLWELSGISYKDLIDKLIQLAIERFEKEQKLAVE